MYRKVDRSLRIFLDSSADFLCKTLPPCPCLSLPTKISQHGQHMTPTFLVVLLQRRTIEANSAYERFCVSLAKTDKRPYPPSQCPASNCIPGILAVDKPIGNLRRTSK